MLAGGTMEPVGEVEQQLLNKSTKGVMRLHHPETKALVCLLH